MSPVKRLNRSMQFGLWTRVGPRNHVLDWGPDPPWEAAILQGKWASHCKVQGHSAVPCANTAEPIEMSFGLWARMGRRNPVLDGCPAVLRDVAMATNFVTQFVITGFMGYNFGCMVASDTQFDSRGGFWGSSYLIKT